MVGGKGQNKAQFSSPGDQGDKSSVKGDLSSPNLRKHPVSIPLSSQIVICPYCVRPCPVAACPSEHRGRTTSGAQALATPALVPSQHAISSCQNMEQE